MLCFDLAGRWIGRAETPNGWRSREVFAVPGPCETVRFLVTGLDGARLVLDPRRRGRVWARSSADRSDRCGRRALWRELRARVDVPAGCALQLWTLGLRDRSTPGADTLPGDLGSPSTLAWTRLPGDPRGALVGSDPATYLWVGGLLTSDGTATPRVEQVRVDVATESWLIHLPPVYAEPGPSAEFLDRAMRWMQSELRDDEELLDLMPARFDPWAADDARGESPRSALDEPPAGSGSPSTSSGARPAGVR